MKIQLRVPMKLKMRVHLAGDDYSFPAGSITDRFPDEEAIRLIEKGYAVPVDDEPERAVRPPPPETRRKGRKA